MRRGAGREAAQQGAVAVELALVLPLLLLLLIGILEFALLFNAQISITHAAREGARLEAVDPDNDAADVRAATLNALQVTNVDPDEAVITVAAACDDSSDPGDNATVQITYDYTFLLLPDFSDSFFGGAISNPTIGGQAVMRCGG